MSTSNARPICRNITLPSVYDQLALEARVTYYKHGVENNEPVKAIVISHPYGPLGGNYDNNVVLTIEHSFLKYGYLTVAFNFRGSGNSKGRTSWGGEPESGDYKTMLDFLANDGKVSDNEKIPPIKEVVIAGYSYGSLISSTMVSHIPDFPFPVSFLMIGYPLSVIWFLTAFRVSQYAAYLDSLLAMKNIKVLYVYGDSDQFTGVKAYRKWVQKKQATAKPGWTVKELENVDHFWAGRRMGNALVAVLDEWINSGP